jgi:hypothetical protein
MCSSQCWERRSGGLLSGFILPHRSNPDQRRAQVCDCTHANGAGNLQSVVAFCNARMSWANVGGIKSFHVNPWQSWIGDCQSGLPVERHGECFYSPVNGPNKNRIEAVELLGETLDEEKAADEKLTEIAQESANKQPAYP